MEVDGDAVKRRVRKQTSDEMASLAALILNEAGKWEQHWKYHGAYAMIQVKQLKALCASVLSQDEMKGKRRKVRK